MDISFLCRSCMKNIEQWEASAAKPNVMEMFCYCTKIMIQPNTEDNLPINFCHRCTEKIELSYNFIKEAQRADVALKNMVIRSRTVIIQPESYKQENDCLRLTLPDYKISATVNVDCKLPETMENEEYYGSDFFEKPERCTDTEEKKSFDESVERSNVGKFKCSICSKCFISKFWYSRHIQKEHASKFICPHCNKTFLKSSQLSYHMVCHSQERFGCNTCGKKFKRRKQLATHTHTHTDIRPYVCDTCNMRFKCKSVLKCHMKMHESQKQYLCSFCGSSFAQAGNLKVHIRRHTGDKPFACAQCPFRASVASNFRRHVKTHGGAKSHVCHHCRKGFYDAGSLARHRRTHTGELPYKCPECDRAFIDSWKRKTHLMRTHQMKLQDIPKMTKDGRIADT